MEALEQKIGGDRDRALTDRGAGTEVHTCARKRLADLHDYVRRYNETLQRWRDGYGLVKSVHPN